MRYIDWNESKNIKLQKEREICFEDVLVAIAEGNLLDILIHPNSDRYNNQSIFVVRINNYIFLVPFVEDEKKIFLKTIVPSRKLTKQYIKGEAR